MLLYLMIFPFILGTAWSQEEKISIYANPAVILEMRKNAEICAKQFEVDPNTLRKMAIGNIPNDKSHKQFLQCVCFNSKFVFEDGHFNVEEMMRLTPINGTQEDFKKYLEDCNKVTRENNLETVYEMGECLHRRHTFQLSKDAF